MPTTNKSHRRRTRVKRTTDRHPLICESLEDRVLLVSGISVNNVGLAVRDMDLDGQLVAFSVAEADQANSDINGDGDSFDEILHVFDIATGATTYVQSPTITTSLGWLQLDDNLASFLVDESVDGVDLNRDRDALDLVPHLFNYETSSITNVGVSATPSSFRETVQLEDNLLVFQVSEADEGATDLSGDGDALDRVLFVYEIDSGRTNNLGFVYDFPGNELNGKTVVMSVGETSLGGIDINGDGDLSDRLVQLYDSTHGWSTPLPLDARGGFEIQEDVIVVGVSEAAQGQTDLNGDGDTGDSVLHIVDLSIVMQSPFLLVGDLIAKVEAFGLNQGDEHRLEGPLNAARQVLNDLNSNNDGAAVTSIEVFLGHVEAMSGTDLSEEEADQLTELANSSGAHGVWWCVHSRRGANKETVIGSLREATIHGTGTRP